MFWLSFFFSNDVRCVGGGVDHIVFKTNKTLKFAVFQHKHIEEKIRQKNLLKHVFVCTDYDYNYWNANIQSWPWIKENCTKLHSKQNIFTVNLYSLQLQTKCFYFHSVEQLSFEIEFYFPIFHIWSDISGWVFCVYTHMKIAPMRTKCQLFILYHQQTHCKMQDICLVWA